MALLLNHIQYAQIVREQYYPDLDEAEFITATILPDIRHILGIAKTDTHIMPTDITSLSEFKKRIDSRDWRGRFGHILPTNTTDAFYYGFLTHSMVDWWWSQQFEQPELYLRAYKVAGDIVLFDQQNTDRIVSLIQAVVPQLQIPTYQTSLNDWYDIIVRYFTGLPDQSAVYQLIRDVIPPEHQELDQMELHLPEYLASNIHQQRLQHGLEKLENDLNK